MRMEIKKLWFADKRIYIRTAEGETLYQSLYFYPRLLNATQEQREDYEFWEYGIRWDSIDEDMSYENFYYSETKAPAQGIQSLFLTHPELNQSAVARRLGIQQSLLASYIKGTKKPSKEREQSIVDTVRQIGSELASATL